MTHGTLRLRWLTILTILIISFCVVIPARGQQKHVIGYYTSWSWRSDGTFVTPAMLPYDKLTMINYAFFYPLPDGRLVGRDTTGDRLILKSGGRGTDPTMPPDSSLVATAHRHKVMVLLSIGGWEDSGNFPAVASNETARVQFAHSCAELIRQFKFDGIDIDWEYPCYAEHNGTSADRANFTKLLNVIRDTLNACGAGEGKRLLLTAALPAGPSLVANYDLESAAPLLDMLNVMTYDFSGTWERVSGHNSPLRSTGSDTIPCVDAAFNLFTKTHGVPTNKVNIGIPFYGHSFANCTSLGGIFAGTDTIEFPRGCDYSDIMKKKDRFTRHWDDIAKVPYLLSISGKTFVSYDDEESVGYKARYVLDQNAGGVIIWEITGDRLADGRTPLLDVIAAEFRNRK